MKFSRGEQDRDLVWQCGQHSQLRLRLKVLKAPQGRCEARHPYSAAHSQSNGMMGAITTESPENLVI
jgi:hypothetical protein